MKWKTRASLLAAAAVLTALLLNGCSGKGMDGAPDTQSDLQETEGDFSYAISDGEAILLGYTGSEAVLTLPESIAGHPVKAVGENCFLGNKTITEVVIPDSYRTVLPRAFSECRKLHTVTLGLSLQAIDRSVFSGSGVSMFRVYEGMAGDRYCRNMGYPNQDIQVAYLSFRSAGYVVGTESCVYYWKYHAESFEDTGLLAAYPPVPGVQNQLICRTASGQERVLFEADGCGKLALAGGRLFYESPGSEGTGLRSCFLDGTDTKNLGGGTLLSTAGGDVVLCTREMTNCMDSIDAVSGQRRELADGAFLACEEGLVYYQPLEPDETAAAKGRVTVSVIAPDGSGQKDLYTTVPDLYSDAMQGRARVEQLALTEEAIYFSYGSTAGTAESFQGGKIVRMNKDGSGAHVVAGDDALVAAAFNVQPDGSVVSCDEDIPSIRLTRDSYMLEGKIYAYDGRAGRFQEAIVPADYAAVGDGLCGYYEETVLRLFYIEQIGQEVYGLFDYGRKDPNETGWRANYTRQNAAMLHKDLKTGGVTILYTY